LQVELISRANAITPLVNTHANQTLELSNQVLSDIPDSSKPPLPTHKRAAQSNDERTNYMPTALVRPNFNLNSTKNKDQR